MHLALTDRTFCPQCGPEYGLILLAHDVRERRVLEGDLGCSKCDERYPVRGGFADLRPSPRDPFPDSLPAGPSKESDPQQVLRLGALLGVTEGPGTLLLVGPEAVHAGALAGLIDGVEAVTLEPALVGREEEPGVSRLMASGRFPFFTATFRGVLLSGASSHGLLEEATRVLAPRCRLVILGVSSAGPDGLTALGLTVLLDEDEVLVAEKERSGSLPLLKLRGP